MTIDLENMPLLDLPHFKGGEGIAQAKMLVDEHTKIALITLPVGEWAVFEEVGPLPSSIQQLNYKIWNEWLPGNPEYELRGNTSIEWYDPESTEEDKCHTAVWLPVQKKH